MIEATYYKNYDGALESARWVYEQTGRAPFMQRIFAYINVHKGDYPAAREAFEIAEPRWFDPDQWRAALEQFPSEGCVAGMLLRRTGEEDLGRELQQVSLDYLQDELPQYVDHTDRYGIENCLVELGRYPEALEVIRTRFGHGHVSQWWLFNRWPLFDPLRGDPDYEALIAGVEQDMASQRAELLAENSKAP